ncbi:MAG: hypothetical protein LBH40_02685 [Alphaproteobacteria bacterium]|jgi:hypothetical protein|nr:hypothetical protein [Alphaproteobacteria bacterium]
MFDGTIRHIAENNPRELGTYEEDDFKSHNHDMQHDHDMSHEHHLPWEIWKNGSNRLSWNTEVYDEAHWSNLPDYTDT